IAWDALTRAVTLSFESLERGDYALTISAGLKNARGVELGEPRTIYFARMDDITALVDIGFSNTRYDRATGAVSYDVTITNTGDFDLVGPLIMTLDPQDPRGNGIPLEGVETGAIWILDLTEAL